MRRQNLNDRRLQVPERRETTVVESVRIKISRSTSSEFKSQSSQQQTEDRRATRRAHGLTLGTETRISAPSDLPKLTYRFLGRSGLQVSSISLGGLLTNGGYTEDEKDIRVLESRC
ncbi:hypothetical protein F5Y18DRAFT_367594 [Xylariaceae sp. FL1019]|nr:hypothetical protein F5Y18DRAFT_367594 [Xylariaceae sp. FL1019]